MDQGCGDGQTLVRGTCGVAERPAACAGKGHGAAMGLVGVAMRSLALSPRTPLIPG